MKSNKKIKQKAGFVFVNLIFAINHINAVGTPTFDNGAAQTAANGFLDPISTFALWAIPIAAGVAMGISGLVWMSKDEDEKENKPFVKTAKRILIVAIIVECIPALLKIFGLQ